MKETYSILYIKVMILYNLAVSFFLKLNLGMYYDV